MYETVYVYISSQEAPGNFISLFILMIIIGLIRVLFILKKSEGKTNLIVLLLVIGLIVIDVRLLVSDTKDIDVLEDDKMIEEISSSYSEIIEGWADIEMYPSNDYYFCTLSINNRTFDVRRMYGQEYILSPSEKIRLYIANDHDSKDHYYDYVLRIDVWRD